jgi:antirepressor protein
MADKSPAALVPRAVREVTFYGDVLLVALVGDVPYVAIRPIAEFLGLEWGSQYNRIKRDDVLTEEAQLVLMAGADGKQRDMFSLPLEFLPGWLFGVTPSRARPEYKERLTRYRRDCFRVLWQALQADLVQYSPVATALSPLAEVRGLALAVAQMAEQQMELQEQFSSTKARMDQAIVMVGDLERRLKDVEEITSPKSVITNTQATEISNQVKALAELLTQKYPGKNHYQGVFGELYRRFGVSSYKLIRQEQYQTVLDFLERWRKAAQKEDLRQGGLF